MSNAERQRQFRERNPGYYGRLHARRRAAAMADAAKLTAAAHALAAKREPLALPAPAVTVEIPGINTIPLAPAVFPLPTPEAVMIPLPAANPWHRDGADDGQPRRVYVHPALAWMAV